MKNKVKWTLMPIIAIFITMSILFSNIKITLAYSSWKDIPNNELSSVVNPNAVEVAELMIYSGVNDMNKEELKLFISKLKIYSSGAYWALDEDQRDDYYYDIYETLIEDIAYRIETLKDETEDNNEKAELDKILKDAQSIRPTNQPITPDTGGDGEEGEDGDGDGNDDGTITPDTGGSSSGGLVGATFEFHGFDNDRPSKDGHTNVVPTSITIGGKTFGAYCKEKGHRLRTKGLLSDYGYTVDSTSIYHARSRCGSHDESDKRDTSARYFGEPVYTTESKYLLTGKDDKYQYVAYIFANLGKNSEEVASWTAQRAIWMTKGDKSGKAPINDGKDILQIDTETEYNADIQKEEEIRILSQELNKVEEYSVEVQLASTVDKVISSMENLKRYYIKQANNYGNATLKNFYLQLANSDDGVGGVLNWVYGQLSLGIGPGGTSLSDIKANVYQYAVTINNPDNGHKNLHLRIQQKIDEIAGKEGINEETAISIAGAGMLKSEGYKYQDFYDDLKKNNGQLKVENKTTETYTMIDRISNTYTVGPFKIKYNDAFVKRSVETGARINFAEITAIRIYDQNNNLYKTLSIDIKDEDGNIVTPGKNEFKITKSKMLDDVDPGYIFPKTEENFYVQFQGDGLDSASTLDPSQIRLEIDFRYVKYFDAEMYATAKKCAQPKYKWVKEYIGKHTYDYTNSGKPRRCSKYKYYLKATDNVDIQDLLLVTDAKPYLGYTTLSIEPNNTPPDIPDIPPPNKKEVTMLISGIVWEDENGGKESLPDGIKENGEEYLKNIEVSLYEYTDDGEAVLATLAQDPKGKEIRTNPTLTDKNGRYIFKGVRPTNKYFVQFTYNGQTYQATKYTSQKDAKRQDWPKISVASEDNEEREELNEKFTQIGSSPKNYSSSNSLGYGVSGKTFTDKELKGYALVNNGNGAYAYKKDKNTLQLLEDYSDKTEGIISKKIQEYIKANKKYPDLQEIYDQIVNEYSSKDPEIEDKLQYIEDTKMYSQTGHMEDGEFKYDLYASHNLLNIYDRDKNMYVITDTDLTRQKYYLVDTKGYKVAFTSTLSHGVGTDGKATYHKTYEEQNNVNLGLNARTTTDLAIKKDVQKATIEINGKQQVYEYDHRNNDSNKDSTWDINVRLSDGYYDSSRGHTTYTREIYPSDYDYKVSNYGDPNKYGKEKSDELEVYVTYRISIVNQSPSIHTKIDEIVEYYDNEYTYIPERSYIEIPYGNNSGQKDIRATNASRYQGSGQTTTIDGYNNLYIQGLDDIYLTPGQMAYAYVTFRVNKTNINGEDWVILDEELTTGNLIGVGKENIVEINGYTTKYDDGTQVPNVGNVGGKPAGIVDVDSTPGNLNPSDVPKDGKINYEAFEDDTDKAPNIQLRLYRKDDEQRSISGIVWEDERNQTIEATTTGNGIREDKETPIDGVTVQLVELMENGTEYVWREFGDNRAKAIGKDQFGGINTIGYGTGSGTQSSETPIINNSGIVQNYNFGNNQKGRYAFKSFVPGNYIVRFIYGDTVETALVNPNSGVNDDNTNNSKEISKLLQGLYHNKAGVEQQGLNDKSYNGQDYKSTTYQKGVEQTGRKYVWKKDFNYTSGNKNEGETLWTINAYDTNNCTQNESATSIESRKAGTAYYYDIAASDPYNTKINSNVPDNKKGQSLNVSDAKDIMSENPNTQRDQNNDSQEDGEFYLNTREEVINYSDNNLMNHMAEVLASFRNRPGYTNGTTSNKEVPYTKEEVKALVDELLARTKMTAETGLINLEIENNTQSTANQSGSNNSNTNNGAYIIRDVDLGLEERPKAQIAIEKEVTNVKVTLADKSVLFDANGAMNNVLWQDHKQYETGYANGALLDASKFGSIENIRDKNSSKYGVIQISMDEELMHGATIQITYKITARNVGEADYKDNKFYYTGEVADKSSIVTTTPDEVIDYVANNLQFYAQDNKDWKLIAQNDRDTYLFNNVKFDNTTVEDGQSSRLNARLKNKVNQYSSVIVTDKLATPLVPQIYKDKVNKQAQTEVSTSLVLTQLITPENQADDLTYRNITEVIRTDNTVGRRNEYSVAGNQNPDVEPQEMDTDRAEEVKILPPFGASNIAIIIATITIIAGGLIAVGVIFIKRKVLKK